MAQKNCIKKCRGVFPKNDVCETTLKLFIQFFFNIFNHFKFLVEFPEGNVSPILYKTGYCLLIVYFLFYFLYTVKPQSEKDPLTSIGQ